MINVMRNIHKIILVFDYKPGSAVTSRMLAFAKGYANEGIHVFVLIPFEEENILLKNPIITYVPVKHNINKNKFLNKYHWLRSYIRTIKSLYDSNDTIIHIYNAPYWGFLLNKKKYHKFYTRGEVPFYAENKDFRYLLREFLQLRESKNSDGLIAQTRNLKKYYSDYGVKNICVANMMVDTERFDKVMNCPKKKIIAYCGTVSAHKDGVDDLIKSFAIVSKKHPDYTLRIIGGFDVCYENELYFKRLLKEYKLKDNVIFTGRVHPERLPLLLAESSILALARPNNVQAEYGFPTKIGEYLCANRPMVITKVGTLDEFFVDKETCLFAEPNNYVDFSDKLNWLIEHPNEAEQIAQNALKLINIHFSVYNETRKVLTFMNNTLIESSSN